MVTPSLSHECVEAVRSVRIELAALTTRLNKMIVASATLSRVANGEIEQKAISASFIVC
jgi:hypothetical protein